TAIVRRATNSDNSQVIRVLTEGFVTDPVFVWMFPEPTTRLYHTRRFFEVLAPGFIESGESDIDGDLGSVGLWLSIDPATPPDHEADAALMEQFAEACGPHIERLGIITE